MGSSTTRRRLEATTEDPFHDPHPFVRRTIRIIITIRFGQTEKSLRRGIADIEIGVRQRIIRDAPGGRASRSVVDAFDFIEGRPPEAAHEE